MDVKNKPTVHNEGKKTTVTGQNGKLLAEVRKERQSVFLRLASGFWILLTTSEAEALGGALKEI